MIRELLEEINASISAKQYYVALSAALTVPDIGGAMDSENGWALPVKAISWFDRYVSPKYYINGKQYIDGNDYYQYRCAITHQGRANHSKSRYKNTLLVIPSSDEIYVEAFTVQDNSLILNVAELCSNMVISAYEWLEIVEETDLFKKHSETSAQVYSLSFGLWPPK